ncbi:mannitol dehydrogenase family protein [Phytohalomonas tamaricis]|uniref:mannitol dehydrogenase family protein n=1 Tax=Phytohalomonas tamaricis TaxID=2081032 RepID=UPI000D0BDB60|nr:mannitol dehydrogenase family protein [Phytohalomonas tamaricis]
MVEVTRVSAAATPEAIGIVHLGLGAFHRAHQAVYLQRCLNDSDNDSSNDSDAGRWGVCSANIRSNRALVDQLREAGYRYHVAEYGDSEHVTLREIDVIQEALFTGQDKSGVWGDDLDVLLDRMAAPETRIVTLTVTEKGYYLSPAEGRLREDDSSIAADIANPERPRTAPGLIVAALRRRREQGLPPFAVLSCDNMPDNGRRTRAAVVQLAARQDEGGQGEGLAEWIEANVAFPSSMVDRIVPAMTDASFDQLRELGCDDDAAVVCEAFSQWVVEDDFPQGRPQWEHVGVEMVDDVGPFETMKLRMLNGSHSLLAYVGTMAGFATVAEAIADPAMAGFIHRYMTEEAAPTLDMPVGVDVGGYAEQLVARFGNDSLKHRLQQIAMDGSQKLPQRLLHGAEQCLSEERSIDCTALGIAAWIRYTKGVDANGETFDVSDPLREIYVQLHAAHGDDAQSLVMAFLALRDIFPARLAERDDFAQAVMSAYRELVDHDARQVLAVSSSAS